MTCLGVIGGLLAFWWSHPDEIAPAVSRQPLFYPIPVDEPAAGVFLVASRQMPDPRFQHTVILLLAHGDDGTLGLIINRPTAISLLDALPDLGDRGAKHLLFFGGPVALNSLMFLNRSPKPPAQAIMVLDDVYVSSDRAVLEPLLDDSKPTALRFYFGHAGWGPGQLHAELARGSWRLFRADADTLFQGQSEMLWEKFIGSGNQIMVRQPGDSGSMPRLHTPPSRSG